MRAGAVDVFRIAITGLILLSTRPVAAVDFTLEVFADGVLIGTADQTRLGCVDNPDGVSAHCYVVDLPYGTEYPLVNIDLLDITIDSDPVVTGTQGVTNLNATTQQITLLFTLPVTAMPAGTLTGGSYRGSFTDNNGNGVTVATGTGIGLYTALLDGADWQTLYSSPQSFSAGNFLSGNIPADSFGSPIPSLPGPAVLSDIGIRLDFSLTGLDSASFTSNHVVEPVPEPGTAALLGLGLAFLAKKRRK